MCTPFANHHGRRVRRLHDLVPPTTWTQWNVPLSTRPWPGPPRAPRLGSECSIPTVPHRHPLLDDHEPLPRLPARSHPPATPASRNEPETFRRRGPDSSLRGDPISQMRRMWAPAERRHGCQRRKAAGTCDHRSRAPWARDTHSRAALTQLALEPRSDIKHAHQAAPAGTSDSACRRAWAPLQQSSKVL